MDWQPARMQLTDGGHAFKFVFQHLCWEPAWCTACFPHHPSVISQLCLNTCSEHRSEATGSYNKQRGTDRGCCFMVGLTVSQLSPYILGCVHCALKHLGLLEPRSSVAINFHARSFSSNKAPYLETWNCVSASGTQHCAWHLCPYLWGVTWLRFLHS